MKFVNSEKLIYLSIALAVLFLFILLNPVNCLENISMSKTDSKNLALVGVKAALQSKIQANLKLKAENKNKKNYSFQSPPGTAAATNVASEGSNASSNISNINQASIILNDWLMISSKTFRNGKFYPEIYVGSDIPNYKIKVDPYDYRLNDGFQKDSNPKNSPANERLFWFRLTNENIFYSSTIKDLNILGGNKIEHIQNANAFGKSPLGYYCFNMTDKTGHDWRLCSEDRLVRNKWFCEIQKLRGINVYIYCNNLDEDGDGTNGNGGNKNIIYKNVSRL